jgi:hypothetical protein
MHRHPQQFLFCLMLLLSFGITGSWALENGIYHVPDIANYEAASNQQVHNLKDVAVGERFLPAPQSVTLESQDNANSDYKLSVMWSGTPRPGALAVIVDDKCLPFTYSSGGPEGESTEFDNALHLSDPKLVERVAAFFKIKPFTRHHPGHQFTCEFITQQGSYPLNGTVPVTLKITNCGKVSMCFSREGGADEEHDLFYPGPFTFTADRRAPDNFGGDVAVPEQPRKDPPIPVVIAPSMVTLDLGRVALMPGESFTKEVNLADYLKLDKPGFYQVRGSFYFALYSHAQRKVARENPLDWRVLWYECASGQFEFRMKGGNGP